ncbi:transmembrane protein 278-like [Tamandua tetradactyla]|uniref:transmembrane protein 278-like n=1 Tax=Tamandua tetradactyla TaxID=48850 RepID=UPI004053FB3C
MSETEEEEGGGAVDTAPMLPRRPPERQAPALLAAGWAGSGVPGLGPLLLPGRALTGLVLHLLLPAALYLLLLLPPAAVVYLGFLCHSRGPPAPRPACRALLSDRGSAALVVLGLLALPPLLLALTAALRARLARRLGPLLLHPARSPGALHPNPDELRRAWV